MEKGLKMIFDEQVYRVQNCNVVDCKLHKCIQEKNIEPIQLQHSSAQDVRIVIVTEQPKILKNKKVRNDNFWESVSSTSTLKNLEKILGKDFSESIQKENGVFYWTHHTKCPSEKRLPQNVCAQKYLHDELLCFENLKLVISFGSTSFNYIVKEIMKEESDKKMTDYFYELLTENIALENDCDIQKKDKVFPDNKSIKFLALPHPSSANPLSALIPKIKNLINQYIDIASKP